MCAGLEEHGRHEDGARALVDGLGQALGQRVRRLRRQADDLEPGFVEPRELAAQGVELAVGAHEPRAPAQVEGREQADDELVGVDAQGDLAARVAEQRPQAGAHLLGLGERAPPLLVHVARGVLEGLDVALERDVRPRLVRVPGQQQPLGDAEARVVVARAGSQPAAHRPQVGEGGVEERRAQVRRARRAAGARLVADRPLDHLDVAVAPLLKALVDVDQALAHLRLRAIDAVDVDEDVLHRLRRRPPAG